MSAPTYLSHAQLVLPDRTVDDGALVIEAGRIAAICPETKPPKAREWDLAGALLTPGLIDLHCDAVESLAEPRPGVYFPFDHAAAQIDRTAAACGITTFYNAVSFAGEELGLRNEEGGRQLVEALAAYREKALIDLRVHCRFEVTSARGSLTILNFIERSACHLVSYMDHSPGQGQFRDEAAYRDYMISRYGYDNAEVDRLLLEKAREKGEISSDVEALASAAAKAAIPFAGHDADSPEQVAHMVRLGARLVEFPMNLEAARAGRDAGLHQSAGATNVVRGGSQRTGMSALELVSNDLVDCLCSDYFPSTMLPAVFRVARELDRPVHEAMKLVTRNPAIAAGLDDRGEIRCGRRADLVAVRVIDGQPHVECVWCEGVPVLASRGGLPR